MPISLARPIQRGLGSLYEALGRPRYALGRLLQGEPGQALGTLFRPRRLTTEEKVEPAAALGMPPGIAARLTNVALDPALWLGAYGVTKLAQRLPERDAIARWAALRGDLMPAMDQARILSAPGAARSTAAQQTAILSHLDKLDLRQAHQVLGKGGLSPANMSEQGAAHFLQALPGIVQRHITPAQSNVVRANMLHDAMGWFGRGVWARKGSPRLVDTDAGEAIRRKIRQSLNRLGLNSRDVWPEAVHRHIPKGQGMPVLRNLTPQGGAQILTQLGHLEETIPAAVKDTGWISRPLGVASAFSARMTMRGTGIGQRLHFAETESRAYVGQRMAQIRQQLGFQQGSPSAKRVFDALNREFPTSRLSASERTAMRAATGIFDDIALNELKVSAATLAQWKGRGGYVHRIIDEAVKSKLTKDFTLPLDIVQAMPNPNQTVAALQRRLGSKHYIHDIVESLDAYAVMGARKRFMEPAIRSVERLAVAAPPVMRRQVGILLQALKGMPSEGDVAFLNRIREIWPNATVAQVKQFMRKATGHVYISTLGGNVGSVIKNLTQTLHNFAALGPHWAAEGIRLAKTPQGRRILEREGVFGQYLPLEQMLASERTLYGRLQRFLMRGFRWSDRFNRGAAYLGARAKALAQGASMDAKSPWSAHRMALDFTDLTQYGYTAATMSELHRHTQLKPLIQFTTWPSKFTEMILTWTKDKNWAALARYVGYTSWLVYAARATIGADVQNFFGTGIYPAGLAPIPNLALSMYQGIGEGDWNRFKRSVAAVIPAGVQGKRMLDFMKTAQAGWKVYDQRGRLRYEVTTEEAIKRMVGLWPHEWTKQREYVTKMRGLKEAYQDTRRKAIRAIIEGAPRDAELLVGQFTAETGIPIRISPSDLRRADEWANMPAADRYEATLPKVMRPVVQQWRPAG